MKQKSFFLFIIAILALMMSSCSENGPFTLAYQGTVENIYKDIGNDAILLDIRTKDGGKFSSIPISSTQDISTIYKIANGTYVYIYKVSGGEKYSLSSIEMTPQNVEAYWEIRNDGNNKTIGVIIVVIILVVLCFSYIGRLEKAKLEIFKLSGELKSLMPDKDDDD